MITSSTLVSLAVCDNKDKILLARDVSTFLTKNSMISLSVIFLMDLIFFYILLFRQRVLGFPVFWQIKDIYFLLKTSLC